MTETKYQSKIKYVTPIEKMAEIIAQANASSEGNIWDQDELWVETMELLYKKSVEDFTWRDGRLVTGTFQDMLNGMGLKDTGFDSYEQMRAVFLGRA